MSYCIITYDVGEERVNRVRKILKRYLNWVQNSVFEGEIGEGKLEKCLHELKRVIKEDADSIYIYRLEMRNNCRKLIIGQEKEGVFNLI